MVDQHPVATHYLPSFITAPGETDVLMVVMAGILLFAVLGFGILFLRLHSLPERIAHRSSKLQFEIVAVLCLIALFTHMHIFWIAALLLALIDLPDFGTPLGRIAGSLERIAADRSRDANLEATTPAKQSVVPSEKSTAFDPDVEDGNSPPLPDASPKIAPSMQKDPAHA